MAVRPGWLPALALASMLLADGCGTVASVRALRKGESALCTSLGGPVARVAGMDIPMPYAVARYRYGLNDQTGLYAGGHLMLAAFGVIGLDCGASHQFLSQQGWVPAVSGSAGIAAFVEPGGEQAFFPQLDLCASYLYGRRYLTYFGCQSMCQLADKPAFVPAPFVGQEVRLGRRLSLGLEAKWYAPTEETSPRSVDYRMPIGGRGALGFVLGVNYHFGGWYE